MIVCVRVCGCVYLPSILGPIHDTEPSLPLALNVGYFPLLQIDWAHRQTALFVDQQRIPVGQKEVIWIIIFLVSHQCPLEWDACSIWNCHLSVPLRPAPAGLLLHRLIQPAPPTAVEQGPNRSSGPERANQNRLWNLAGALGKRG